jgi:hypothetical protein
VSDIGGALTLPIPAGTPGQRLADPAIDALLEWCAHWLTESLDARLANLVGTSATALPTANRFAFDPLDPRGHHVRLPIPALFIWWTGRSRIERLTIVKEYRYRELSALYVFDDLPQLAEHERRAGLMAAVDAAFHKASEARLHTDYGTGDTFTFQTAGDLDSLSYEYLGGEQGRFTLDNDKDCTFPCLRGAFAVRELIGPDESTEDLIDASLSIDASDGSTSETIHYMDRELEGPDGSEED